jgi:hypothetical protein
MHSSTARTLGFGFWDEHELPLFSVAIIGTPLFSANSSHPSSTISALGCLYCTVILLDCLLSLSPVILTCKVGNLQEFSPTYKTFLTLFTTTMWAVFSSSKKYIIQKKKRFPVTSNL